MTLLEPLLAAGVFLSSAAASVQLWVLAAGAAHAEGERQRWLDRLDAELIAVEARLRREIGAGAAAVDCAAAAERLAQRLREGPGGETPGGAGSEEVRLRTEGDRVAGLVRVEVATAGGGEARQRWFSPGALGLCRPPASPDRPTAAGSPAAALAPEAARVPPGGLETPVPPARELLPTVAAPPDLRAEEGLR